MLPQNKARLILFSLTMIVAVGLFLFRWFKLKDQQIKETIQVEVKERVGEVDKTRFVDKEITLIQKKNYERRLCDISNIVISWIIFGFGMQPWRLLETSAFFGYFLTLIVPLLPISIIGFSILGFKLQKNDFDWLLIMEADTESKIWRLNVVEYFIKDGVKYAKAESLQDAMNDNFTAILIDVERERFWVAQLNDQECKPIFAEDVEFTGDTVKIQTYIRDGAIITRELIDSQNEREIASKDSLNKIIKKQELDIGILEDTVNLLKSQRKKGIIEKTAERIAVFFNQFDELAGLSPDEKYMGKKIADAVFDEELKQEVVVKT